MDVSGHHRGAAAGGPVTAALKSVRWIMSLVAVALVPALVLAAGVYLIWFGTELEVFGVSWLMAMTVLIYGIRRGKWRQPYFRWLMSGWLLVTTWNVLNAFAHRGKWAPGQMHALTLTGYGVAAVSGVLLVIALVIDVRSGGFGQRWASRRAKDDASH
jgi:hypothetical protein